MCLIVFSYKQHPDFPFILAGNRDEFFARPTLEAHFWDTKPEILAGRDQKAGGTWLGISRRGRIGAITNYRDFNNPREGERSRGEIIPKVLLGKNSAEKEIRSIGDRGNLYGGFNLLAGSLDSFFYINNISGKVESVSNGFHGISNAYLNTPWPKVEEAKKGVKEIISNRNFRTEELFEVLLNSKTYDEHSLPDTGLSKEMEKKVSSIFIDTEEYGTRCSTVLLIDKNGHVSFTEKTYLRNDTIKSKTVSFEFEIE